MSAKKRINMYLYTRYERFWHWLQMTLIFILLEAAGMPEKLRAAAENPEESISRFSRITESVKQYLAIKTLVSVVTGIVIAIALFLLGLGYLALKSGFVPKLLGILLLLGKIENLESFSSLVRG